MHAKIGNNFAGSSPLRRAIAISLCLALIGAAALAGTLAMAGPAKGGPDVVAAASPIPAGVVDSISPTSGPNGTTVTIAGSFFGTGGTASDYVTFGAAQAVVSSWDDYTIVCIVPFGITGTVQVTVYTAGGPSNTRSFTVTAPPVSNPSTFYFAEGYTGAGFQEYLCLGNPGNLAALATVTYMFPDGTSNNEPVTIPAHSRTTVDINAKVGAGKEVSLRVDSDSSIIAERPMYFAYQGAWSGGSDVVGASAPAATWYFAEGYTGPGFDEYICVLNPGGTDASLTFRFQTQEAGVQVIPGLSCPAHSRRSFKANDLLGGNAYQTSLQLDSSQPVVAERSIYFNYLGMGGWNWTGGDCVMGATSLGTEYYFAEGTTRFGFEEWLTLQNPGGSAVTVSATYQLGAGQGAPISKSYNVPAGRRITLYVPQEAGFGNDVSVHLAAAAPFLAERPMYFNYTYQGKNYTGGHCVIGAAQTAAQWFFAEGYTGAGFDEWLCLQNPGAEAAQVQVTYFVQGSSSLPPKSVAVPANSRVTLCVNDHAGTGLALSANIDVTSGPGIIAERPIYFSYNGWDGGHDVTGYRL